ncbi:MAG: MFS transporter [Steroidobacteraceae bacterium]
MPISTIDVSATDASAGHPGWAIFAHSLLRIGSSADGVLIGLYLAALSRAHGVIHAGLVGLLAAVGYGAELLASVPLGLAADAFSVRVVMVLGALTIALGVQLFALSVTTPLFVVSQLMLGLGVAGVTPPLLKFLTHASEHRPTRRARVMGFFELSMLAGLALGGLVGAQLWVRLGMRSFSAVAVLAVACALLLGHAVRRVPGEGTRRALQGLREALRNPWVRGLAPSWICVNAIIGLWLGPTLTFLLTERPRSRQYLDGLFATRPTAIGWMMLGYTAIFAVGVSLWSMALPKMRLDLALRLSLSVMFGVCLALFAINHSASWGSASRWGLLTVTALLIMVESGFTPAALAMLAQSLEAVSGKGAAMGIYSLLLGLGAVVGSLLAGFLGMVWQVDGLLLGTVVLAGVALLLLKRLPPAARPMETKPVEVKA